MECCWFSLGPGCLCLRLLCPSCSPCTTLCAAHVHVLSGCYWTFDACICTPLTCFIFMPRHPDSGCLRRTTSSDCHAALQPSSPPARSPSCTQAVTRSASGAWLTTNSCLAALPPAALSPPRPSLVTPPLHSGRDSGCLWGLAYNQQLSYLVYGGDDGLGVLMIVELTLDSRKRLPHIPLGGFVK